VVAVAPAEGVPAAAPALGESPASTQFDDTGQVVVANGGRALGEKQFAAMLAKVAAAEDADEVAKAAGATGAGGGKARAKATPAAALAPSEGVSSGTVAAAQTPGAGNVGGIDFSSLELRYIADPSTQGTRASAFAFKAVPGKSGGRRASIARRVVREASDAFFVWLALPPQSFTVNLNPSEPDRIVDSQLGRTDAGRILLEADLRMKKTVARLIHPRSRLGARFWAALDRLYESQSARACLSFRFGAALGLLSAAIWPPRVEATVRSGPRPRPARGPASRASRRRGRSAARARPRSCARSRRSRARSARAAHSRRTLRPHARRAGDTTRRRRGRDYTRRSAAYSGRRPTARWTCGRIILR